MQDASPRRYGRASEMQLARDRDAHSQAANALRAAFIEEAAARWHLALSEGLSADELRLMHRSLAEDEVFPRSTAERLVCDRLVAVGWLNRATTNGFEGIYLHEKARIVVKELARQHPDVVAGPEDVTAATGHR